MKLALWLAWREFTTDRRSSVLAIVAMALAVGICVITELTYRARETAVSTAIDSMGSSLFLIPSGKTSKDLARFELGSNYLPAQVAEDVKSELSASIRAAEGRLLLKRVLEGVSTPIVGIATRDAVSPFPVLNRLSKGRAVLGQGLAKRLDKTEGDQIRLGSLVLQVSGVLSSMASGEDFAMFVSLHELQNHVGLADEVNAISLFPFPGESRSHVVRELGSRSADFTLIVQDNDDAAREDMDQSLSEHRWVIYVLTSLVAAFCVLMWSNLNASERKVEMATMVAIGGPGWMVFLVLALRAGFVALGGALLGNAVAIGVAFARDPGSAGATLSSWGVLVVWPIASVLLGVAGALPISILSATREHVRILQG
jgi:ABC-type antimicrobial peptide transport system permease subunit